MLVQISAGQGPEECQMAVGKLLKAWKISFRPLFHRRGYVIPGRDCPVDMQKPGETGT